MARSAGLGRAPDGLGTVLRTLAFSALIVWAALRAGAVVLADLLVVTLGMVMLALWELAALRPTDSSVPGRHEQFGHGVPLAAITLGLPLALGPGPGIRGALELVLFWGAFAWGLAVIRRMPGRRAADRAELWGLRILVTLGIVEAMLGLTQTLLGMMPAGPSLPTTEGGLHGADTLGIASGSLRNPNHYATLLAVTLAPALGLLQRARIGGGNGAGLGDRWLARLGLLLWPLALLASRSRGGALAAVGGGLVVWLGVRGWRGRHRLRGLWGGLALATLGGIVALAAIFRPRFELWGLERRLLLYGDVVRWIGESPWWGHGLGLFRWRFRPHQHFELPDRYDHAHNEYLEVAAEVGLPLAVLLVVALGWWWWTLAGRARQEGDRGLGLGALLAVSIVALHGMLDFGTRIPLNTLLLGVLMGAALGRRPTFPSRGSVGGARSVRIVLWGLALVVLGAGMVEAGRTRIALGLAAPPPFIDAAESPEAEIRRLERVITWAPELPSPHLRLGLLRREVPAVRSPKLARDHLERAMALNPWSWRYPRELARLYDTLGQFDQAQAAHALALARDPRAPRGHWQLVELGLRHDRPWMARTWLRNAVAGDPRLIAEAVPRWFALGGTVETLVEAWPRALQGELLDELAQRPEFVAPEAESATVELVTGDVDPLDALFESWIGGLHAPKPRLGATYLELLLATGQDTRAREAWHRLLAVGLGFDSPTLLEDRLWNGDFESPLVGGPLGWNVPNRPGQRGERVAGAGPDGSTALRIVLDPRTSDGRPARRPRQTVVVDTGETLVFTSALAVEGDLAGARLQLFDPVSREVLAEGPSARPGEGWVRGKGAPIRVGERRRLRVRLAFAASEGRGREAGTVWVDKVELRPEDGP